MSSQPKTFLTPEEYLEIERKAERKSEYYQGEMFAMAGASREHGLIVTNVTIELGSQVRGRPCEVHSNDLRMRVSPTGLYTYPDVIVVCGEFRYADDQNDTLLNPTVIIEVLSRSTRDYDRGMKFEQYRKLPSLREYLTIDQYRPHIEHWTRQQEHLGLLAEYDDLGQTIELTSIGCVLALAEVYDKVKWTDPETAR
jgi:Uma2 family endonuclease